MLPLLWLTWLAAYALPLVGAYLIINGIDIDRQATTVYGQILAQLGIGFGLLAIGLGALIGVVKTGFARLEKRLSPAPETLSPAAETAASSEQLPPPSDKPSLLDRLGSMKPRT
jgi:hypothetical protein